MKNHDTILRWLDENTGMFTDMAGKIWGYAEPAWREHQSAELQKNKLKELGFTITDKIGGIETAFSAERGTGKPIIGFLGEYDALPGLSQKPISAKEAVIDGAPGHGCGHNLLGTGCLAAAVAVSNWLEENGGEGTIRYYGCPAEEEISGKTFMARSGCFDDLDVAFNYHPASINMPGKGSAVGVYNLHFKFTGKTAHAGGAPHRGRSALDGVELMNVGVNYLREHVPEKVRMHYAIIDGGRVPNIVPETAAVWYFLRAPDKKLLDEVLARVRKVADGAALMTETSVEMKMIGACSSVLNNHYLADLHYQAMKEIGPIAYSDQEIAFANEINTAYPEENRTGIFKNLRIPESEVSRVTAAEKEPVIGENFPAMDADHIGTGSTDVGDVSWITPLSMLTTACSPTGASSHSWGITAASGMSIGNKGMMHAAKIMACAAAMVISDPDHLKAAREEFEMKTADSPYVNPLPPEVELKDAIPKGKALVYDYLVIGSGFGGSVSALRLAEKGYSVLVLEEGRRYADDDFPETNNNPFRYFWLPKLGCRGFQRITFFKHAAILGAAGVGGGSINYANTLLKPPEVFFESTDLPPSVSWREELAPFFDLCAQMLRPVKCPAETGMDTVLKKAAESAGVGDTWYTEDVAVHFGEPDVVVPDPYFDGQGPERAGCSFCGGCMIGCRNGAKNSLTKNYLHFAESLGVEIQPESKAVDIIPGDDGYVIEYIRPGLFSTQRRRRVRAKGVIFAGGVVGTLKLLFTLQRRGRISVSNMLGHRVRTNSESLIGVRKHGKDVDYSEGVAITSGTYIDKKTHVEVVRYPNGANALSILTALLTDKRKGIWRPFSMAVNVIRHPFRALRTLNPSGWARESIILLVMQTEDNCIKLKVKRRLFGGFKVVSDIEEGSRVVPVYIPQAHQFAREIAADIGAVPLSNIYEVFFNASLTAHILGGCIMGEDDSSGVIDTHHRLFGYEDLYVVDASVIPANLGVNPVMTIVAFAERAMSLIPKKQVSR